jgi:hypothetical protein
VDASRLAVVSSYSTAWPCLFPQHGPGRKHERAIRLTEWQEAQLDDAAFLRGLVHSDGCRVLNRVAGKTYPRYFFSQVSTDIKELFCRSCRRLGVEYRRQGPRQVSIARAASVSIMDTIVGPKS